MRGFRSRSRSAWVLPLGFLKLVSLWAYNLIIPRVVSNLSHRAACTQPESHPLEPRNEAKVEDPCSAAKGRRGIEGVGFFGLCLQIIFFG